MDASDIATIVLSSLALLVSIATLFLTFLYKRAALVGCLALVTTPEATSRDNCVFEFALSNTGTLELLIRDVSLDLTPRRSNLIPDISPASVPIVLKPGQVQLLRIEIPNLFLRKIAQNQQGIVVQFHIFSSRGTFYMPEKTLIPKVADYVMPEDAWAPFLLGKTAHRSKDPTELRRYHGPLEPS
jgi:hypothetical protein